MLPEYFYLEKEFQRTIFHIPKHQFRLPVYAHKKIWQRIDDNLVEMTKARLDAILTQIQIKEVDLPRVVNLLQVVS